MVGAVRFELTTSCTRNKRASQATLRPDAWQQKVPSAEDYCNYEVKNVASPGSDTNHSPARLLRPANPIDKAFPESGVLLVD